MKAKYIDKPWGHEEIWAHTDKYVGKILHIKSGHQLSLQYHEKKEETILVLSGDLTIVTDAEPVHLSEGESYHIPVTHIHSFSAPSGDVALVEVSTPELDDVVRLEDKYGRV